MPLGRNWVVEGVDETLFGRRFVVVGVIVAEIGTLKESSGYDNTVDVVLVVVKEEDG